MTDAIEALRGMQNLVSKLLDDPTRADCFAEYKAATTAIAAHEQAQPNSRVTDANALTVKLTEWLVMHDALPEDGDLSKTEAFGKFSDELLEAALAQEPSGDLANDEKANKAGGLWYRRWKKAKDELTALANEPQEVVAWEYEYRERGQDDRHWIHVAGFHEPKSDNAVLEYRNIRPLTYATPQPERDA